jgi:hypothetical protein
LPFDDAPSIAPRDRDINAALERSIARLIAHHQALGQALALLAVAALATLGGVVN